MRGNRRAFLGGTAALLAAGSASARPGSRLDRRLGFSTTSIRDRLPFRLPGAPPPKPGTMTLLDAPAFAASTVGLRNLEIWNLQFADLSNGYCRRLREAATRAGVAISNVQVDSRLDLGSPDGTQRALALAEAQAWVERAALIGARSLRVNFSVLSPKAPFVLDAAAESMRALAEHGRGRGIMILTENHIGHTVPVANVVAVLAAVNHPHLRAIYDWGNVPEATTTQVLEQLVPIAPWLYQVSAKGVVFDAQYHMTSYDVAAITRATERVGFRGLYSIELFGPTPPRFDPLAGIASMRATIAANLKA
jgi:sugar phosphate isomerase/epimerase